MPGRVADDLRVHRASPLAGLGVSCHHRRGCCLGVLMPVACVMLVARVVLVACVVRVVTMPVFGMAGAAAARVLMLLLHFVRVGLVGHVLGVLHLGLSIKADGMDAA